MSLSYGVVLSELEGSGSQYVMVFDTVRNIVSNQNADIQTGVVTSTVQANTAIISPVQNANISAVVITLTGQANSAVVTPVGDANIVAPIFTGTSQANAPVISPEINVSITGVVVTANGQPNIATINPIRNIQVDADITTFNGHILVPSIGSSINANIFATPIVFSGQVTSPNVNPTANTDVQALVANTSAQVITPIIETTSGSIDANITSVTIVLNSQANIATINPSCSTTISGVVTSSSGQVRNPNVIPIRNASINATSATVIVKVIGINNKGTWPVTISLDTIQREVLLEINPRKVLMEVDGKMRNIVVTAGNTVTLKATFYNQDGIPTDPAGAIKFIIFDEGYDEIQSFDIDNSNRVSEGVYALDYTTPRMGNRFLFWEGSSTLGEVAELDRKKIELKWVV